jgi:DNA-binding MarR family transcriptional regulator
VVVVVCLLVAAVPTVGATPVVPTQTGVMAPDGDRSADLTTLDNRTGVTQTSLSGLGIAARQNGTTYVWQDGRLDLSVTMFPLQNAGEHQLCLDVANERGTVVARETCRQVDVRSHGSRTTFELQSLDTNATGPHTLVLTLEDFDTTQTTRLPVVVVSRDGDLDDDSLNNTREIELGTGIDDPDTDSDGLLDGLELTKYESDPTMADSDQDGLRDGRENNIGTGLTNPDSDGDGLTDGEEVNEYGTDPLEADTDGDGLSDAREIELGTEPDEPDSDTDGLDDAREVELGTDPTDPDTDDDGLNDGAELEQGTDPLATQSPADPGPSNLWGITNQSAVFLLGAGTLVAGLAVVAGYVRRREPPTTASDSVEPTAAAESADAEEPVDTDLLSPEQHVMHLLETNDGQMKQSQFVEETDWSKAKVSRKLSRLEEDGKIKRVRIGRENVVTYPDRDLGEET